MKNTKVTASNAAALRPNSVVTPAMTATATANTATAIPAVTPKFDSEGGRLELIHTLFENSRDRIFCSKCEANELLKDPSKKPPKQPFTLTSASGRRRFQCKLKTHSHSVSEFLLLYFPAEYNSFLAKLNTTTTVNAITTAATANVIMGDEDLSLSNPDDMNIDYPSEPSSPVAQVKRMRRGSVIHLPLNLQEENSKLKNQIEMLAKRILELEKQALTESPPLPTNVVVSPPTMINQQFSAGPLNQTATPTSTTAAPINTTAAPTNATTRGPQYAEVAKQFLLNDTKLQALKEARQALRPPPKRTFSDNAPSPQLERLYVHGLKRMSLGQVRKLLGDCCFDLQFIKNISFVSRTTAEFLVTPIYVPSFKLLCQELSMTILPSFDSQIASDPHADEMTKNKVKNAFLRRLELNALNGKISAVRSYFTNWLAEVNPTLAASAVTNESLSPAGISKALFSSPAVTNKLLSNSPVVTNESLFPAVTNELLSLSVDKIDQSPDSESSPAKTTTISKSIGEPSTEGVDFEMNLLVNDDDC